MSKDGFNNEKMILESLNNKRYKDLNENLKLFCKNIFSYDFQGNEIITAQKPKIKQTKTDVIVSFNGIDKNISIKKGSGNSVHQETLDEFVKYLENKQVPIDIINNLKLFHYGDDTIEGNGNTRYTADECKIKYSKEIAQINNFFNQGTLFEDLLDRFLFIGNIHNASIVDFIYYGSIYEAIWASRQDIIKYFKTNKFNSSTIHIASLTYQVWGRDPNRNAKHPNRRYIMQIKWGNLMNNLKEIQKLRSYTNNDTK